MRPLASALVKSFFDPGTCLRAWLETGYQAPTAATFPGCKRLRGFIGCGVDDLDVRLGHAILLECLEQEQVFDEGGLDSDLLAFQILDRFDSSFAKDHVAAITIIENGDNLALGTIGTIDEGVGRDNCHRIDFACSEGVKRRQVVEPNEIDINASVLEPFLLLGDLKDRETRPITISDLQGFGARPSSTNKATTMPASRAEGLSLTNS